MVYGDKLFYKKKKKRGKRSVTHWERCRTSGVSLRGMIIYEPRMDMFRARIVPILKNQPFKSRCLECDAPCFFSPFLVKRGLTRRIRKTRCSIHPVRSRRSRRPSRKRERFTRIPDIKSARRTRHKRENRLRVYTNNRPGTSSFTVVKRKGNWGGDCDRFCGTFKVHCHVQWQ